MPISIDEVTTAAITSTGLSDFGSDDYLDGLQVLLNAANSSPHRGAGLDLRVKFTAISALESRLRSQSGWSARPECLTASLAPQIVVVGLPRSGTTALHQMLAADPRFQWIPAWLAPNPRPRPASSEWDTDHDHMSAVENYQRTGPNALHDVAPDDPEECLQLMRQSFTSMLWVSSLPVPEYHEWFVNQDERPSYSRFADNLRLIGADEPNRPWLLKNPSHTFGMAAMIDTFPDAVFIHIFRDPAESIVSGCSLIASLGLGDGTFNANELGAHRLRIWSMAAERFNSARDANPGRKVIDVDYRKFVSDPLSSARDIYSSLGIDLEASTEVAMRKWHHDRPKDKHGTHRYSAEDFGLATAGIRDHMKDYVSRYSIDVGRSGR